MKVNKKLVASIIVGALLLTSGGLAMANDTVKWGNSDKNPARGQITKEARPAATCLMLDELVKDKKITPEEADQYRGNMQNRMNGQQAERQALKQEQFNTKLDTVVNNGDITLEQANVIKEKFAGVSQEKMGKRQAKMRVLQDPDFLADLISEGIISAKQGEAFVQGMCNYR